MFAHLKEKGEDKWKKKKIIPFKQNLLGSIRPFPEPIQFFVLGASLSSGKPPKRDSSKRIEPGKVRFCFWPPARRVSLRASSLVAQIVGLFKKKISVRTAFKGYRLPTSCKKHTGTGSSSPKRTLCSLVWLDPLSSLYRRAFIISLYKEFKNSV